MRILSTLVLLSIALTSFSQSVAPNRRLNFRPVTAAGGSAPSIESVWSTNFLNVSGLIEFTMNIGASAANRVLVVGACAGDDTFEAPIIWNVNGTSITNKLIWNTNDVSNFNSTFGYYMIAPPTGSVTNQFGAGSSKSKMILWAVSLTNASQTAPIGNVGVFGSAATTAPTVSLSSAPTEIMIGACNTDAQTTLAVTTGTQIWTQPNIGSDMDSMGASAVGAATSTITYSTGNQNGCMGAVCIKAP